jgi:glycerol-3-phosphate dehydrogenase
MGGQPQTISGLSGMGDLLVTAFGELSRNRLFGEKIAR